MKVANPIRNADAFSRYPVESNEDDDIVNISHEVLIESRCYNEVLQELSK